MRVVLRYLTVPRLLNLSRNVAKLSLGEVEDDHLVLKGACHAFSLRNVGNRRQMWGFKVFINV